MSRVAWQDRFARNQSLVFWGFAHVFWVLKYLLKHTPFHPLGPLPSPFIWVCEILNGPPFGSTWHVLNTLIFWHPYLLWVLYFLRSICSLKQWAHWDLMKFYLISFSSLRMYVQAESEITFVATEILPKLHCLILFQTLKHTSYMTCNLCYLYVIFY